MVVVTEGTLRVWWIRNVPNQPQHYPVSTIDQALHELKRLENEDLADSRIETNAGGLEVFEDGEWLEYYDEDGRNIDEIAGEI